MKIALLKFPYTYYVCNYKSVYWGQRRVTTDCFIVEHSLKIAFWNRLLLIASNNFHFFCCLFCLSVKRNFPYSRFYVLALFYFFFTFLSIYDYSNSVTSWYLESIFLEVFIVFFLFIFFSLQIPRFYQNLYSNFFFPCTSSLTDFFSGFFISCHNHFKFKWNINRYILNLLLLIILLFSKFSYTFFSLAVSDARRSRQLVCTIYCLQIISRNTYVIELGVPEIHSSLVFRWFGSSHNITSTTVISVWGTLLAGTRAKISVVPFFLFTY